MPCGLGPGKGSTQELCAGVADEGGLVQRAIFWAVASGIATCLQMIAAFGSAYFGVRHEPGAAILFVLSLGLFTFSLISFAREIKVAMKVDLSV